MAIIKGGDKAADVLKTIGDKSRGLTLSVGFFEGATYPDGTSVPEVAFTNEFGVPQHHQPPRPFFRNMIAQESSSWGPKIAAAMKGTGNDGKKSLELVGDNVKGALIQSITDLTSPPLAPATIARKGFDKPLVDTGQMRNSITFKVDG